MKLPETGGISFKYRFKTYRGNYIKNPPDVEYIIKSIALQHNTYYPLYLDPNMNLHRSFPAIIPDGSYMVIMESDKLVKKNLFKSLIDAIDSNNGLDLSPSYRALNIAEVKNAPAYIPDNPYSVMWHFIHTLFVYKSTFTFN